MKIKFHISYNQLSLMLTLLGNPNKTMKIRHFDIQDKWNGKIIGFGVQPLTDSLETATRGSLVCMWEIYRGYLKNEQELSDTYLIVFSPDTFSMRILIFKYIIK